MKKQTIFYTPPMLRRLAKQCGLYAIACHMRKQGYSLEITRAILLENRY